jgi:inorganic pyrophosphatase
MNTMSRAKLRIFGSTLVRSIYSVRQLGKLHSSSFKRYVQDENGKILSSFHDVPVGNIDEGIVNMIVEIPRWTNAKLEICKHLEFNPIIQDSKKENLRYVANLFPFRGYVHNYGALPQTWENPKEIDRDYKSGGDNDPLDVCEIGQKLGFSGQVKKIKVLGCMPLIDEGETDWKIIAVSVDDPFADKLHDIEDVENHLPGLLEGTRTWFRDYKVPDGKQYNHIGPLRGRAEALRIIADCHEAWQRLVQGKEDQKNIKLYV